MPQRNDKVTPWEDLGAAEQCRESRKMELYASMVDNVDHHIGRLLSFLKETGLYDNTLIVFMSNNGAAAEDFFNEGPFTEYLQANFDNAYENMGTAVSFVSYDDPWAEAGSAPFMRRKTYTREGGIVAPMIIAGPGVAGAGRAPAVAPPGPPPSRPFPDPQPGYSVWIPRSRGSEQRASAVPRHPRGRGRAPVKAR